MTIFITFLDTHDGPEPCFFSEELHGARIPPDAVEISQARKEQLLVAQSQGHRIEPDTDGKPRISRNRPSSDVKRAELNRLVREEAARRIEAISPLWKQLNDSRSPSPEGSQRFARIDAVREANNAIEQLIGDARARDLDSFDIPNSPLWPEFE